MKRLIPSFVAALLLTALFSSAASAAMYDLEEVREQLTQNSTVIDDSGQDMDARIHLIQNFVKDLKRIDDHALGDPRLFADESREQNRAKADADLALLRDEVTALTVRFNHDIKPVLVNNVFLERHDKAAQHNKGELASLFFPTRNNHRTGRVISGIWSYQEDISSSFFSKQMVEAGLAVNFPELKDEVWLRDAMNMEAELLVLLRMHREYQDGARYEKVIKAIEVVTDVAAAKKSTLTKVKSSFSLSADIDMEQLERDLLAYTVENPDQYTLTERDKLVHQFASELKSLDEFQTPQSFKQSLEKITQTYLETVKPILVANVRYLRKDLSAQNNKGDVLSLFFKKSYNHYTGKPVSGKLVYQEDRSDSIFGDKKMADVGMLAENPELKQEKFIQDALLMEAELMILSLQHKKYMYQPASIF